MALGYWLGKMLVLGPKWREGREESQDQELA